MAAMDVQRLQQQLQLQALQKRLTEESQQRRQLQAELEQVLACNLIAALGLSSCLCRQLQAKLNWASKHGLCGCHSRVAATDVARHENAPVRSTVHAVLLESFIHRRRQPCRTARSTQS